MTDFDTPIAMLNFNRPHLTRQVFEVIRQIRPRKLLLIADGPRADRPNDVRLCAEVRAIFDEIDWECEVLRNFADSNMGSFKRNSSGLNWVFDTIEEAIILEDDCVPSLSFFPYCAELLGRYRDDSRIAVISGNSFVPPARDQADASYFFSTYSITWGWASWRRVWKQVDMDMSWWQPLAGKRLLKTLHSNKKEWKYWYELYRRIWEGKMNNAWDYQLILSSMRYEQYCVIPRVNLISNIGYGPDGTHCFDESSHLNNLSFEELELPLVHPSRIERSMAMDSSIFQVRFQQPKRPLSVRIKRLLLRIRILRFLNTIRRKILA